MNLPSPDSSALPQTSITFRSLGRHSRSIDISNLDFTSADPSLSSDAIESKIHEKRSPDLEIDKRGTPVKTEDHEMQPEGAFAWVFIVGRYLRKFMSFVGPGYIIAVGYMDPGNWATDLAGGSRFGYTLLFVILFSNFMAILLQSLAIKLGIVTGLDLAQACRKYIPWRYLNWFLYVVCELAIIACDLAEVIGSAIALNMLFGLDLPYGVIVTGLDVFLILLFYKDDAVDPPASSASSTTTTITGATATTITGATATGDVSDRDRPPSMLRTNMPMRAIRIFEAFVMLLVGAVGICFVIELVYSKPDAGAVFRGYLPLDPQIITNPDCLYVAIGIIGATVMPHNLYLHSHLVKARRHRDLAKRPVRSSISLRNTIARSFHFSVIDAVVALTFALFVNSSILIVSASNFYYAAAANAQQEVADLFAAHDLLSRYLNPAAGLVFALALLFSGQSSTLTATMAGQIVMEGFLDIRLRAWVRRLFTRSLAIIPAVIVAIVRGRDGLNDLLVASQVALSIQLPFAIIPLVIFTSWGREMRLNSDEDSPPLAIEEIVITPSESAAGSGVAPQAQTVHTPSPDAKTPAAKISRALDPLNFSNPWWLCTLGMLASGVVVGLNGFLIVQTLKGG